MADEEARKRIGVDAVRGVGPLRMIRREIDSAAVAAGRGAGTGRLGIRYRRGCRSCTIAAKVRLPDTRSSPMS